MHQTNKGNQWFFGLLAHIGVDSREGIVRSVFDMHIQPDLLHGGEKMVWGDAGYQGQSKAIRKAAPEALDMTSHRVKTKAGQDHHAVDSAGGEASLLEAATASSRQIKLEGTSQKAVLRRRGKTPGSDEGNAAYSEVPQNTPPPFATFDRLGRIWQVVMSRRGIMVTSKIERSFLV